MQHTYSVIMIGHSHQLPILCVVGLCEVWTYELAVKEKEKRGDKGDLTLMMPAEIDSR